MTDPTQAFEDLIAQATEVAVDEDQKAIEDVLLAGALASPEARDLVLAVSPRDFYFDLYRRLATLTWPALREGGHVDRVTFRATLPDAQTLRMKPEDRDALLAAADAIFDRADFDPPAADQVGAYLKIFTKRADIRRAKALADRVGEELDQGKLTPAAAAAKIAAVWADLEVDRRLVTGFNSEAEDWPRYFADLEARQDPGRVLRGLDTGFDNLNALTAGLSEGLFVLAALPGAGKTTFAKQLGDQVATLNPRVACLFVSLEQSREELRAKTLARLAQVPADFVLRASFDVNAGPWAAVTAAADEYQAKTAGRFFILEGDLTTTPDKIRLAALRVKREAQVDQVFVIVDYLQICPVDGDYRDRRDQVDAAVSELRRMARALKSPVMAISSVSRASYNSTDPSLGAFKESGGIEFAADLAGHLIYNKEEPGATRPFVKVGPYTVEERDVTLGIVKQRNGQTKNLKFVFTPSLATYREG